MWMLDAYWKLECQEWFLSTASAQCLSEMENSTSFVLVCGPISFLVCSIKNGLFLNLEII